VLKHASLLCPAERTGRPRALTDKEAFAALFKVARTGMQWRERRCKAMLTSGFHMTLDETEAEFDRLNNAGMVDG
jgi:hypothetical protein